MTAEANKELARRFFRFEEQLAAGEVDFEYALSEFLTPNFRAHIPGDPELDLEGARQALMSYVAGFPNFRVTVQDQVADDDKVVTRAVFSGVNTGEFGGIAPTGREVIVEEIVILRIVDGRIAELWVQFDNDSIFRQLGVVGDR